MRLIFCTQASKTKQHQNKSNPYFGQWMTKVTQVTALSLILIGFGYSVQHTARADTTRIDNITIDRQPNETYDSLVQRAESAARAAVEQSFDQGSRTTNVSVVILGQNQGVIAPVLAIGVSRPQWRSGGNEITYFNSARSLLRLEEQQLATADSPQEQKNTPSVPTPPPQTNPNNPGSSRQLINNSPTTTPVNPAPGATPSPVSPGVVPSNQTPGITPVTSPSNTQNSGLNQNSGNTQNSGLNQNSGNTQNSGNNQNSGNVLDNPSPSVTPATNPTPGIVPQGNSGNTNPN
jgi:hypothetical protein